jgi:hypothetical protein
MTLYNLQVIELGDGLEVRVKWEISNQKEYLEVNPFMMRMMEDVIESKRGRRLSSTRKGSS